MADGIRLGMDDRLKIMLSPATATVISAVAVFLTLACGQQANTPLVYEISQDSLEALSAAARQGDAEAVRWFHAVAEQAEQGHASAQYQLGIMYDIGSGVPQGDAEAARWYHAAAEQGHASAQHQLGNKYSFGSGVPESDAEAVRWYRAAAEQGHAWAQYNLGNMYARGEGVPENYVLAYAWMNLAGAQGHWGAQPGKDELSRRMTSEQVARAQGLSVELLRTINQP